MKKICITSGLFLCTIALFGIHTKANAYENIVGYTINSNHEEGYLYQSDLSNPTNDSTVSGFSDYAETYTLPGSRVIVGDDDRTELETYQYTTSPYNAVCKITVGFDEMQDTLCLGTGFLVGPHTILTACHVLYDCSDDHDYGWFDTISISFGTYVDSNGNTVTPYGTITSFSSASCGNFHDTDNTDDDWALLDLNVNLGDSIGYFGVTSSLSNNDSVKAIGYSGDLNGNMAYSFGTASNVSTYQFKFNADIISGASGGAVVRVSESKVCGIISAEESYWLFGWHNINYACRISPYIVAWIEERL